MVQLKKYVKEIPTIGSNINAPATGHTVGSYAQPVSAALQRLMKKNRITTAQVNHEIQQTDVSYLAAYFDNFELYVDAMELSPGEQCDVRKMESNHLAMIKCLNIWKRKKPSQATFRALLEMLVKLKKGEIADNVCHYITEISTTSVGTQSLGGSSVARGQEHTTEHADLSHATEVAGLSRKRLVRSGTGRGDEATEVDTLLSNNGLKCTNVDGECKDDHILKYSRQQLERQWDIVATLLTQLGLTAAEI